MKHKELKSVIITVLLLVYSCGDPETTVTNIIHPDGSVTRRIEMRGQDQNFEPERIQVPYDSTWAVKDTIEIDNEKDTTWVRIAEKKFENVGEINELYRSDKGTNADIKRSASFTKHFRWFFTTIRFSESLNNTFIYGYPMEKYLSEDEIEFFYMPDNICEEKLSGPDSTKYKDLNDSISEKSEHWMCVSLVSEWIEEFLKLVAGKAGKDISQEALKSREEEVSLLVPEGSDSSIFISLLGEKNYKLFTAEADSASAIVEHRFDQQFSFNKYSVKYIMPGKVVGTNGFIDKIGEITWPVKSEYFFTEPFEMWAESKISNFWAWAVSGIFLLFIVVGLIIRKIRK
jgi:hypothetical protein